MAFADVNGQHLYFEDAGGSGIPVIFSHGFLMDHEMFAPQVSALAGDFRCITWDERGFGQTEATGPFSYWDSAADALALLSHLDIDAAFFVGMSQGGFLSLRAALLAPQRVRGLGLIDTSAGVEPAESRPAYEAMSSEWVTNGPSEALSGAVAAVIMSPGYDPAPWIAKWMARPKESILEPFRTLMGRDDLWDQVSQIVAPAIVFHGEADAAFSMDEAERLAHTLPRCEELVRIAGAGHAANLSHPDEVNGPLREFLGRHS
jgi:pimeloyl-ACP methyl ester carboxylesterase